MNEVKYIDDFCHYQQETMYVIMLKGVCNVIMVKKEVRKGYVLTYNTGVHNNILN